VLARLQLQYPEKLESITADVLLTICLALDCDIADITEIEED
jgi:DNA-binding Xre family transcriptional regulator